MLGLLPLAIILAASLPWGVFLLFLAEPVVFAGKQLDAENVAVVLIEIGVNDTCIVGCMSALAFGRVPRMRGVALLNRHEIKSKLFFSAISHNSNYLQHILPPGSKSIAFF